MEEMFNLTGARPSPGYFFCFGCWLPSSCQPKETIQQDNLEDLKIKGQSDTLLFARGSDIPMTWPTAAFTFLTADVPWSV